MRFSSHFDECFQLAENKSGCYCTSAVNLLMMRIPDTSSFDMCHVIVTGFDIESDLNLLIYIVDFIGELK